MTDLKVQRQKPGVGGRGSSSSRFLLNFIFYELKKIVVKWKTVQNYKTS